MPFRASGIAKHIAPDQQTGYPPRQVGVRVGVSVGDPVGVGVRVGVMVGVFVGGGVPTVLVTEGVADLPPTTMITQKD